MRETEKGGRERQGRGGGGGGGGGLRRDGRTQARSFRLRQSLIPPLPCRTRPCVINLFEGELSSGEQWWSTWSSFMFKTELEVKAKAGPEKQRPCAMLTPISSAKYPALSKEEEAISIPLQVHPMCLRCSPALLSYPRRLLQPHPEPSLCPSASFQAPSGLAAAFRGGLL